MLEGSKFPADLSTVDSQHLQRHDVLRPGAFMTCTKFGDVWGMGSPISDLSNHGNENWD